MGRYLFINENSGVYYFVTRVGMGLVDNVMTFQAPKVKPCETTKEEKRFSLNILESISFRGIIAMSYQLISLF